MSRLSHLELDLGGTGEGNDQEADEHIGEDPVVAEEEFHSADYLRFSGGAHYSAGQQGAVEEKDER